VSFADKDTSPITTFFDLGLGGNGLFKSRPTDEFGIAYAYTDLSSVLKDNIDLITQGNRRLLVEHQQRRHDHHKLLFTLVALEEWLRAGTSPPARSTSPSHAGPLAAAAA